MNTLVKQFFDTKPFDMVNFGKDFDKFFVGFDDTYNRLAKLHDDVTKFVPNYPPYNIRKVEDNRYVVELAVAGFVHIIILLSYCATLHLDTYHLSTEKCLIKLIKII